VSFLAPLFFIGLAAIAVPVFVHLIQRERKHVTKFPSLMFVRRIPYQSVRRRRIRHWFLLLMRAAAIALIVAAFARPFFNQGAAASVASIGGDREIVIMLDQSASMGYGDHWDRAKAAARDAIRSLRTGDRASLVLFGRNAEENMRATSDIGRLEAAVETAKLTSGGTRYGFALKLAESILAQSNLPNREAILISDFQRVGWTGAEDVHFAENMRLTPISVGDADASNLSVPSVSFGRASFSGQERITVNAGLQNKGGAAVSKVPVVLELDGREMESVNATAAANASASVSFAQFTLAEPAVRGAVRAGSDPLAADNAFYFVLTPSTAVNVLVIDSGDQSGASFFLTKALSIGNTPTFKTEVVPAARVSTTTLEGRSVVILNDAMLPPGAAGGVLRRYVERGGGLLIAFGARSSWPASEADLLPGSLGQTVDANESRGASIGFRDYDHPVFEIFKAPRSGDFSAVRVLRYKALTPGPDARVLARYDDGGVAAAEKRIGTGRVIALTTTLDDSWSDIGRKPVYLPLVHQVVKYLARYEQPAAWHTVGQVVDLSTFLKSRAERTVITPSGERLRVAANEPGLIELNEQGVYEIRTGSTQSRPDRIAVNLDPAESDLTPLDPQELVAAVTGHAVQTTAEGSAAPAQLSPEEAEKRQGLWWYLLIAGLMILAAEMVVSNVLSRNERFT
jgi:hypothetical protein